MKCSLDVINFLEEISRLSHSMVFLNFFFFLHCSFKRVFLCLLALLWNAAFSWVYLSLSPLLLLLFFLQLFVRPPQTTTLPFCISIPLGLFWSLPPVKCYISSSIIVLLLIIHYNILFCYHII